MPIQLWNAVSLRQLGFVFYDAAGSGPFDLFLQLVGINLRREQLQERLEAVKRPVNLTGADDYLSGTDAELVGFLAQARDFAQDYFRAFAVKLEAGGGGHLGAEIGCHFGKCLIFNHQGTALGEGE